MQVIIDKKSLLFKFENELDSNKVDKIIVAVLQALEEKNVNELNFMEFAKKISKPVKNFNFNRDEIYEERIFLS